MMLEVLDGEKYDVLPPSRKSKAIRNADIVWRSEGRLRILIGFHVMDGRDKWEFWCCIMALHSIRNRAHGIHNI